MPSSVDKWFKASTTKSWDLGGSQGIIKVVAPICQIEQENWLAQCLYNVTGRSVSWAWYMWFCDGATRRYGLALGQDLSRLFFRGFRTLAHYRSARSLEAPTHAVTVVSSSDHAGFVSSHKWERLQQPANGCGFHPRTAQFSPSTMSYKWNVLEYGVK